MIATVVVSDRRAGAATGGPFRAIPTDVPGLHLSELMPEMAKRMKTTCVIRSLNTKNGDHGQASRIMMRGRKDEALTAQRRAVELAPGRTYFRRQLRRIEAGDVRAPRPEEEEE